MIITIPVWFIILLAFTLIGIVAGLYLLYLIWVKPHGDM